MPRDPLGNRSAPWAIGVERDEYQRRAQDIERVCRVEPDGAFAAASWIFFIYRHISPDHAGVIVPTGHELSRFEGPPLTPAMALTGRCDRQSLRTELLMVWCEVLSGESATEIGSPVTVCTTSGSSESSRRAGSGRFVLITVKVVGVQVARG
jgi:hypothetical protein